MVFFQVKMKHNDSLALEASMIWGHGTMPLLVNKTVSLVHLLKFISSSSNLKETLEVLEILPLSASLLLSEGDISAQIRKHEESKSLLIRINPRLDLAFCIPSFA